MDSTIAQQQSFDRLQFPQTGLDMSPQQVSPLSYYDPQADFSADSAPSRGSPISPIFGNAFQLPIDSDWPAYLDKSGMSPDLDIYYGESFGGSQAFVDAQNPTLSPVANPLDLMSESVAFGGDLNDVQPLFQSAPAPTTLPIANPPVPATSRITRLTESRPQSQSSTTPTAPVAQVQTRSQQRAAQRAPARRPADLKRKSSTCDDSASSRSTSPEPPARRTKHAGAADPSKNPHNLIEKRYRVNINEKILALRDAVPALRCAMQLQQPGAEAADHDDDAAVAEELGGLMPARKLNKATILSKATEYISHLEKKNERLARENEELERRLAEAQRWQRTQAEAAGYWV